MVEFGLERYGRLDIVHANAGVDGPNTPFLEHTEEAIERVVRVNLLGADPHLPCRHPGADRERRWIPHPDLVARLAADTDHHVRLRRDQGRPHKLTEALALEYGPQNIRVNAVAPGVTLTDFWFVLFEKRPELKSYYEKLTPLHRWGTTDDMANAVAFLASDECRLDITGITLTVDGGLNLRQADVALQKALAASGQWDDRGKGDAERG